METTKQVIKQVKIDTLCNKINTLLEIGMNLDSSFNSRAHIHDYLWIISNLMGQLEVEIGGVLK
jgi:hypothetical protein